MRTARGSYVQAEHDYDPAWDYAVVEPTEEVKEETDRIQAELMRDLIPQLEGFDSFSVAYAEDLTSLGIYADGTSSAPVIVLDAHNILESVDEFGVGLDTAIETTIVHELGHAVQEAQGREYDEDEAEGLAHSYYYDRVVPDNMKG